MSNFAPGCSLLSESRIVILRPCTMCRPCNILLKSNFSKINTAILNILNVSDQPFHSCMIQSIQANSQHLSGFFTLNQFIHHQNSLPFGICLVFFSPPVPEYNIQAALSQLHQFRASVPYLPCRDTESHRSYHMYQAAPPIPSKILPALLPSEGNNVLAGFFSFESSLSAEQP